MLTNADCTLLLAEGDKYRILFARGVHWEEHSGATVGSGSSPAPAATVYIPFSSLPGETLPERVSGRDYIIRGAVCVSPDTPVREILAAHPAHTIGKVYRRDFGSPALHHWQVDTL